MAYEKGVVGSVLVSSGLTLPRSHLLPTIYAGSSEKARANTKSKVLEMRTSQEKLTESNTKSLLISTDNHTALQFQ